MDSGMYCYWGKAARDLSSYHLLVYHSLDVAAVGYMYLCHDSLISRRMADLAGISPDSVPDLVGFFLSLHDLGKFSESFQNKIPDLLLSLQGRSGTLSAPVRHDSTGSMLWKEHLGRIFFQKKLLPGEEMRNLLLASLLLAPFFSAVFGHHGIPPGNEKLSPSSVYTNQDIASAGEFVSAMRDLFSIEKSLIQSLVKREKEESLCALSWLLAGLCVISDWIGSNSHAFPYMSQRIPLEQYWRENALPIAEKALRNVRMIPLAPSPARGITALFPWFSTGEYSPSPLQEWASGIRPGPGPHLFIIEESTGSGKTEAALTLAHRLIADGTGHGFYFALPTMATSNAMFSRIKAIRGNFFENEKEPPLVLSHSTRQITPYLTGEQSLCEYAVREDVSGEDLSLWLHDNSKKALLAPLGVGTIDQALVAVLPRRYQSLRLFGISRNILIVDEVHAYDPYVNELLRNLICDHARTGGSTILLSATLPACTRNSLIRAFCEGAGIRVNEREPGQYPLVTHVSPAGLREIPVEPRPGTGRSISCVFFESEDEVISELIRIAQSGRCACWIRNTVRDALEGYRRIRDSADNPSDVLLFHARFTLGHRLERENDVIQMFGKESVPEMRSGRILVATQVVEQSLDLDFDFLVTDLAPIDLVIQRAGRLHRHSRGERGNPILGIYAPPWSENPGENWYYEKFPGGSWVYPSHCQLWLTLEILRRKGGFRMPQEARECVEWVYGKEAESRVPPALAERDREFMDEHEKRGRAITSVINFKKGYTMEGRPWPEDKDVPTRLAEPSVTLRLGVLDMEQKTIRPLCTAGEYSWEMSQVSVRRALIGGITYVKELEEIVNRASAKMHDKGRNAIPVPLIYHADGNRWENTFVRDDGKSIRISYTKEEGLFIHDS